MLLFSVRLVLSNQALKHCTLSGLLLLFSSISYAQSNNTCIASPDWGIFVTDYGYADTMVDLRVEEDLNFKGREYLSGEWGHAIAYNKSASSVSPTWLEPAFLFPDWTTNSNFSVISPIASAGTNSTGQTIYQSIIANGDIEITIQSEVIDTRSGIQQGMTPASAVVSSEAAVSSSRYLLQQTYSYKNISGETLSDIKVFQLLHSLSALVALYDDRIYPGITSSAGPLGFDASHHFDSTLVGKDTDAGSFIDPAPCLDAPISLQAPAENVFHYDRLTLHSSTAPSHIDNFYFGDQGAGDNHIFGKPVFGSHINIEAGNLNDWDFFDPGDSDYPNSPYFASSFGETTVADVWVATAQQHDLGSLTNGQSLIFSYLLSLTSTTVDLREKGRVPIPAVVPLILLVLFSAMRLRSARRSIAK